MRQRTCSGGNYSLGESACVPSDGGRDGEAVGVYRCMGGENEQVRMPVLDVLRDRQGVDAEPTKWLTRMILPLARLRLSNVSNHIRMVTGSCEVATGLHTLRDVSWLTTMFALLGTGKIKKLIKNLDAARG